MWRRQRSPHRPGASICREGADAAQPHIRNSAVQPGAQADTRPVCSCINAQLSLLNQCTEFSASKRTWLSQRTSVARLLCHFHQFTDLESRGNLPRQWGMDWPFDGDGARPTAQRPADHTDSSAGGESKRLRVGPWDGVLDLDSLPPWPRIAGTALPDTHNAIPGSAGYAVGPGAELAHWTSSQHMYSDLFEYSDLPAGAVPGPTPFFESWPVLTEYDSIFVDLPTRPVLPTGPVLPTSTISSTSLNYLEPTPVTSEYATNAIAAPTLDTAAIGWAEFPLPGSFMITADQLSPDFGNPTSASTTLAAFETFPPWLLGESTNLAYACGSSDDAWPLVKAEEAAVDPMTEPSSLLSPAASSSLDPTRDSVTETTTTTPLSPSTAEQKKPTTTQDDNLSGIDSGEHDDTATSINYDACFGVASLGTLCLLR